MSVKCININIICLFDSSYKSLWIKVSSLYKCKYLFVGWFVFLLYCKSLWINVSVKCIRERQKHFSFVCLFDSSIG